MFGGLTELNDGITFKAEGVIEMSSPRGAPAPELVAEFHQKLAELETVTVARSGLWGIDPGRGFELEAKKILMECYALLTRIKENGFTQTREATMCEGEFSAVLFRAEQWEKSAPDEAEH